MKKEIDTIWLNRPIQFLMKEDGPEAWVDCVATEDGKQVIFTAAGIEIPVDIKGLKLRHTPLIGSKEIEHWHQQELIDLQKRKDNLYKRSDALVSKVVFRYGF